MDGYGTCQDGTFPNKGLKPFSGAWLLLREALGSLGAGTSSPSEHSLPGRFSARFFSPAFSTAALQVPLCTQPGPHPSALLKPPAGSASPFPAASLGEARQRPTGVPDWEQDHALAGSQRGHPLQGAEPHLSGAHVLPSYPSPSQNPSHKTWDHQVTSVAQQAQTVPERVLSAPGRGTASPATCLLPGPALLSS